MGPTYIIFILNSSGHFYCSTSLIDLTNVKEIINPLIERFDYTSKKVTDPLILQYKKYWNFWLKIVKYKYKICESFDFLVNL